jgi:hypothetical protein
LARRLITCGPALIALLGTMLLGDQAVGTLLVAGQVLLLIALRFAILRSLRATSDPALMGPHTNGVFLRWCGWLPPLPDSSGGCTASRLIAFDDRIIRSVNRSAAQPA